MIRITFPLEALDLKEFCFLCCCNKDQGTGAEQRPDCAPEGLDAAEERDRTCVWDAEGWSVSSCTVPEGS